jgi:hypothetical protein
VIEVRPRTTEANLEVGGMEVGGVHDRRSFYEGGAGMVIPTEERSALPMAAAAEGSHQKRGGTRRGLWTCLRESAKAVFEVLFMRGK